MIWAALIIPFITAPVLYFTFKHKVVWWEFLIPFGASIVLVLIFKFTTEAVQTRDIEYWGAWATHAEYYEAWNERVSCRHPKYKTVRYKGSDGKMHTKQVQDGYKHAYDVDDHGPQWRVHDSNGSHHSVNSGTFEGLARRFGNRQFKDMRRSYHTKDGDMYKTTWPGSDETLEPVITTHSYENRVQASDSVFNFPEVDETDKKDYCLYDYPKIRGKYSCISILGNGGPTTAKAERMLTVANAKLGRKKQVRMWILIFTGQPMQAGFMQQNLWKGGNKNEFIFTMGVDKQQKVQWCHTFSWSEVEILKVEAKNFVMGQETLDLVKVVEWLVPEIDKQFIRKPFAEFSYLSVDPPLWAVLLTFFLVLGANVGISAWLVMNDFKEGKASTPGQRRRMRLSRF